MKMIKRMKREYENYCMKKEMKELLKVFDKAMS
jgi:hypothetical protein